MPVSMLVNSTSALSIPVNKLTTSKLKFENLGFVNIALKIHVNAMIALVCLSTSMESSAGLFIICTH